MEILRLRPRLLVVEERRVDSDILRELVFRGVKRRGLWIGLEGRQYERRRSPHLDGLDALLQEIDLPA